MERPLIIAAKTKACALLWQLDFAIMRPFDAASMSQTSMAGDAIYSAPTEIISQYALARGPAARLVRVQTASAGDGAG